MITRLRRSTRPLIGTWVKLRSLETIELLARAGLDFVILDLEHGPATLDWAYSATVAGQGLGLSVLVRVTDATVPDAQRLLDSGVDGLLVPQIRDVVEVEEAIAGMVFPPGGRRGLGHTSRAGGWGLDSLERYLQHGRDEIFRGVQFETPEAFAQIDAILDVAGLNAAFVGMADLSLTTGLAPDHPDLRRWCTDLVAAAKVRGIPCGTAVGTAAAAAEATSAGFAFVAVSNDASLLGGAAQKLAADARGAIDRAGTDRAKS